MIDLHFVIEERFGRRWKIRDDGRAGPAVADEALLWDALQEALAELEQRNAVQASAVEKKSKR